MKKRYIIPETSITVIRVAHHLCLGSSDGILNSVTTSESVTDDSQLLGRGSNSIWDDDYDE